MALAWQSPDCCVSFSNEPMDGNSLAFSSPSFSANLFLNTDFWKVSKNKYMYETFDLITFKVFSSSNILLVNESIDTPTFFK